MPRTAERGRLGSFVFDLRSAELRSGTATVRLQEQPLKVLAALLEHPGDVVTRDTLRQRLWPADVHVDFERSLNAAVKRLREGLGDSAESPRYVETVPRHGYRLVCPVTFARPPATPASRSPSLVALVAGLVVVGAWSLLTVRRSANRRRR